MYRCIDVSSWIGNTIEAQVPSLSAQVGRIQSLAASFEKENNPFESPWIRTTERRSKTDLKWSKAEPHLGQALFRSFLSFPSRSWKNWSVADLYFFVLTHSSVFFLPKRWTKTKAPISVGFSVRRSLKNTSKPIRLCSVLLFSGWKRERKRKRRRERERERGGH
jgi:hypothetical protein